MYNTCMLWACSDDKTQKQYFHDNDRQRKINDELAL